MKFNNLPYLITPFPYICHLIPFNNTPWSFCLKLRDLVHVREDEVTVEFAHEGKVCDKREVDADMGVAKGSSHLLKSDEGCAHGGDCTLNLGRHPEYQVPNRPVQRMRQSETWSKGQLQECVECCLQSYSVHLPEGILTSCSLLIALR